MNKTIKLVDYTINSAVGLDYDITFNFDDGTSSQQVINFEGRATQQALDEAIRAYAESYIRGKEIEDAKNNPILPNE